MSFVNPLIGAPHVPVQTAAPKWGDFLEDKCHTQTSQPRSGSFANRQHQPVAWYQVKAAQQSQWAVRRGLQQPEHDPDTPAQVQATPSSHANTSSRWKQQWHHTAQPGQHQPPVNDRSAIQHTAELSSSWVHQKRLQQKAAAVVQTDAQENLSHVELRQPQASLQQKQQRQFSCQDVETSAAPVHQAGQQHPQLQQRHWHAESLCLDEQDDVHLPDDGNLPMLSAEQHQQMPAMEHPQQQDRQGVEQWKLTAKHIAFRAANQSLKAQNCLQQQQQQELQQQFSAHRSSPIGHPPGQSAGRQMHLQTTERPQDHNCQPAAAHANMHHTANVVMAENDASILAAAPAAPQRQQQPSSQDCFQKQHNSGAHPEVQQQLSAVHAVGPAAASRWAAAQPLKVLATLAAAQTTCANHRHAAVANSRLEVNKASSSGRRGKGRGRGSRGGGTGYNGGRGSKDTCRGAGTNITAEFIPRSSGSDSGAGQAEKQERMHQVTILETLDRANKKRKQMEQQPPRQLQQNQQHQNGKHQPDGTRAPDDEIVETSAVGLKRTSSAAAAVRPGSQTKTSDGGDGAAGSGRRKGSKIVNKRATLLGQASTVDPVVQDAREELDIQILSSNRRHAIPEITAGASACAVGSVVGLDSQEAWQQLHQELAAAAGAALGLLMCQTAGPAVQYYSSLQQLTKEQQQLLKKHAKAIAKTAAAGTNSCSDTMGPCQVAGVVIMPVAAASSGHNHSSNSSSSRCSTMYLLCVAADKRSAGALGATPPVQLPDEAVHLLSRVLSNASGCPCVCSNAKGVLCSLAGLALPIPAAGSLSIIDPELLGWLLDPQLVQDRKHTSCYTLQAQLERLGMQQVTSAVMSSRKSPGPLQRLHQQMQQSVQLADLLLMRLKDTIGGEALRLEMQVTAVLAKMELSGVGISPQYLLDQKATLLQRIAALHSQAAAAAGRPFNLSSASQLAIVLYEDLKLPPPAVGGGRGSAKTHLPTDEQSLKQLAHLHPLPAIIIEYRCLQNVITKWMDPEWVQAATCQAAAVGDGNDGAEGVADVHCSWNQAATATGRLSSNAPNLQAVTKYNIITAHQHQQQQQQHSVCSGASKPCALSINIRDAFVSRPGSLLLSADYSQVELRLLAHFSGDPLLRHILHQSGTSGDVFKLIAATWMHSGASGEVDANTRERAKRVVYGIIYGLSAFGLSQQLTEQGLTVEAADTLIKSFLNRFQGVKQFMSSCLQEAQATGAVKTLLQRVRPIAGLTASSHRERSAAERKVVNSILQGSAADLIKLAMRDWDNWAAAGSSSSALAQQGKEAIPPVISDSVPAEVSGTGGARLIAQIHDELLFEVDARDAVVAPDGNILAPGASLGNVAHVVQEIMAMRGLKLTVPLKVNLSWGQRWGSMQRLELNQAKPTTV